MRALTSSEARQPRVIVEFREESVAFLLGRQATFQDMAERIAALALPHRGQPLAVEVRSGH